PGLSTLSLHDALPILVVKAYFDRWPSEELQFKRMKSFACLNRVAGYGKKKLPDEKVRATQQQLQRQITALRQNLKVPLKQIADQDRKSTRLNYSHGSI